MATKRTKFYDGGWGTVDDVADYLRRHPESVRRDIRNRGLKAIRIGRTWRLRKPDVDAWLYRDCGGWTADGVPDPMVANPAGSRAVN